ncbi:hypothetical protein [Mesorhizobium sp. M0571]
MSFVQPLPYKAARGLWLISDELHQSFQVPVLHLVRRDFNKDA